MNEARSVALMGLLERDVEFGERAIYESLIAVSNAPVLLTNRRLSLNAASKRRCVFGARISTPLIRWEIQVDIQATRIYNPKPL